MSDHSFVSFFIEIKIITIAIKREGGLGQFADLMGGLARKRGVFLREG